MSNFEKNNQYKIGTHVGTRFLVIGVVISAIIAVVFLAPWLVEIFSDEDPGAVFGILSISSGLFWFLILLFIDKKFGSDLLTVNKDNLQINFAMRSKKNVIFDKNSIKNIIIKKDQELAGSLPFYKLTLEIPGASDVVFYAMLVEGGRLIKDLKNNNYQIVWK